MLADLVESVLGAVFVDSGGDLTAVWRAMWGLVEAAGMTHLYDLDRSTRSDALYRK